jgi:hypothetical protein
MRRLAHAVCAWKSSPGRFSAFDNICLAAKTPRAKFLYSVGLAGQKKALPWGVPKGQGGI